MMQVQILLATQQLLANLLNQTKCVAETLEQSRENLTQIVWESHNVKLMG
jgi:hypothetical protein